MSSKTTLGANSVLLVAIVLALLVLVNLAGQGRFFRIDLTDNNQYTLSRSTKEILRGLDDLVSIKVYFSRDLPTYLVTLNQQVKDLLDEYQAYGDKNLQVQWIDPTGDPETEQRCRVLGIPQVQLQIFEKDRAQVTNAWLGIAILYEDRSEAIPVVQGVENLEYGLTAAILKVFRKEEKSVGFLASRDGKGPSLESGLARAKEVLEQQYRVVEVDLSAGRPVPAEVRTLVVVQPNLLQAREQFEIDQFLMGGGGLLVFHDPIVIPENTITAVGRRSGLRNQLRHYGIDAGENLVLDARSNSNASFNQGFITFSMPYPYWVKVLPENVNAGHPMVNQLGGIVLPWTSTVAASDSSARPDSVTVDTLLFSSDHSWTKNGQYDLNPQQRFPNAPREPVERLPLAVVASGKFTSFFAGKDVPAPGDGLVEQEENRRLPEDGNREVIGASLAPSQVIVLGSGNAILDDMIGQFTTNLILLQNAVDWLTLGDELIQIRSRFATDRPLGEISERRKGVARFLVTLGVPILVILFGLLRYMRRRNRRPTEFAGVEQS